MKLSIVWWMSFKHCDSTKIVSDCKFNRKLQVKPNLHISLENVYAALNKIEEDVK